MTDYSECCDYENLKNRIKDVLRKYFEYDDVGNANAKFDSNYAAADALDDIHSIVGDI